MPAFAASGKTNPAVGWRKNKVEKTTKKIFQKPAAKEVAGFFLELKQAQTSRIIRITSMTAITLSMNPQIQNSHERSTSPSVEGQTTRASLPNATHPLTPSPDYRTMLSALATVYQQAGLPEPIARQAAQADLECDFRGVALAA